MTQAELNQAISQVTGDDVSEIQQRGFSLVGEFPSDAIDVEDFAMPDPQVIDWDSPFAGATQSIFESCI